MKKNEDKFFPTLRLLRAHWPECQRTRVGMMKGVSGKEAGSSKSEEDGVVVRICMGCS